MEPESFSFSSPVRRRVMTTGYPSTMMIRLPIERLIMRGVRALRTCSGLRRMRTVNELPTKPIERMRNMTIPYVRYQASCQLKMAPCSSSFDMFLYQGKLKRQVSLQLHPSTCQRTRFQSRIVNSVFNKLRRMKNFSKMYHYEMLNKSHFHFQIWCKFFIIFKRISILKVVFVKKSCADIYKITPLYDYISTFTFVHSLLSALTNSVLAHNQLIYQCLQISAFVVLVSP